MDIEFQASKMNRLQRSTAQHGTLKNFFKSKSYVKWAYHKKLNFKKKNTLAFQELSLLQVSDY